MITVETAERIVDVCGQIARCKDVLDRLDTRNVQGNPCLIWDKSDDNSVTIFLPLDLTKEVIQVQLSKLETRYAALNNLAIKEASECKK